MDGHSHPSLPFPWFSSLPPPRDSFRIFQKLSEIFSDENNYSLSRELLIKVKSGQRRKVLGGRFFEKFQSCLGWTL